MPRTASQNDDAEARVEDWLDNLDPATTIAKDATPLRSITEARRARVAADRALTEAVEAARAAGHSWAAIGNALGTSRQAAQQRYTASSSAPARRTRRVVKRKAASAKQAVGRVSRAPAKRKTMRPASKASKPANSRI